MTYIYQYSSLMPSKVEIRCPSCAKKASFEFGQTLRIEEKKHIEAFKTSPYFDYFYSSDNYHWKHYASYQPALFGELNQDKLDTLGEISDTYSKSSVGRQYGFGAYVCHHCLARNLHELDWKTDAFYQTDIRGHKLWAYDKHHLLAIRNFIQSTERKEKNHNYVLALYHLPTVFKTRKVRKDVLKAVNQILTK